MSVPSKVQNLAPTSELKTVRVMVQAMVLNSALTSELKTARAMVQE